jgi:hypothetical protein
MQMNIKNNSDIINIAQQMLDGQIGILEGSRMFAHIYYSCESMPQFKALLPFVAIESESDNLPTEETRKYWNKEVLKEKDKEINELENYYRKTAIQACKDIINQFKNKTDNKQ